MMKCKLGIIKRLLRREGGQVLITVLVLLAVGSLILAPLLTYMSTGLSSDFIYTSHATDYYSADAGVEDALWQIKYDHLHDYNLFTGIYDEYGYDLNGVDYDYKTPVAVNNLSVDVNIANVWIPKDVVIAGQDLRGIIENAKLVVAGAPAGLASQKIAISYDKASADPPLMVTDVGVWLPPGFGYVEGSCQLDDPATPSAPYHASSVEVAPWAGGAAVIWHYATPILFTELPDLQVSDNHMRCDLVFDFTADQAGSLPDAVAWIETDGVSDIPFAWDADIRVFKITSRAPGGTEIDAYAIKVEQRQLAAAIPGDYKAIGNSLMTDDATDPYYIRDTMHQPTPGNPSVGSATASDIPEDAEVAEAYLYWSGWFNDSPSSAEPTTLFTDTFGNLNNWTLTVSAWSCDDGQFIGHYGSGGEEARYLTLLSPLNLTGFGAPVVSWDQDESGALEPDDALRFQLSGDGGLTWSSSIEAFHDDNPASPYTYAIPLAYRTTNFKMRFYLASFSNSGEECYLDNIRITSTILFDDCASYADAPAWSRSGGTHWSVSSGEFRGEGGGSSDDRTLTLTNSLNLSALPPGSVSVTWNQDASSSVDWDDHFYYAFSGNGGTSWSSNIEAFHDDDPEDPIPPVTIPDNYKTGSFKIRFYNDYESGEYVYLDNITMTATALNDDCGDLGSWDLTGSAWSSDSSQLIGQYSGTQESARYITLTNPLDLHDYTADVIGFSWDQNAGGTLTASDALRFQLSGDGGAHWSPMYTAAQDDLQDGGFNDAQVGFGFTISPGTWEGEVFTPNCTGFAVPPGYYLDHVYYPLLTAQFKVRFYLAGFSDPSQHCYLNRLKVHLWALASYDYASALTGWTHDADWANYYNSEFVAQHVSGNGYLTMTQGLDLSAYAGESANVAWRQRETGSLSDSDALQFEFSSDGGAHWSAPYTAFSNDIGSGGVNFTHSIPSQYLTTDFKMRLLVTGFGAGKYCYVDSILIYGSGLWADSAASFYIDGHQVSFAADGTPQIDVAQDLVADRAQVINGLDHPNTDGCYYSSFADVTALVRAFAARGPNDNCPGNGTYATGNVGADTGDQQSYAGWSLVIVYTSPITQGHQLYLYDDFSMVGHYENLDFDQDGSPGGDIGGFLVPEQVTGEVYAAKLTCFVGEGDDFIWGHGPGYGTQNKGEYVALNNHKMWDGVTTSHNSEADPDNCWNGQSLGMTADGVDVDTYQITWASGILVTGDTAARLDMQTDQDVWTMVYTILSFRSQTTTGGTVTYLIKQY